MLEEQLKQEQARHVQLEQQLQLSSLPTLDIINTFSQSLQLAAIKELRIQTVRGIFSAANARRFSPSTILDKKCVLIEHSKELIGAANILKFW